MRIFKQGAGCRGYTVFRGTRDIQLFTGDYSNEDGFNWNDLMACQNTTLSKLEFVKHDIHEF